MKAKCIETFLVEKCDDDGFSIENENVFIEKDSIWNIEDDSFRIIGGEIRLTSAEKDNLSWLELPKEIFEQNFKVIS
ncbi:hypothetical protein EXN65_06040 [Clostridium botulinum]|uniref:hypothetical protein n=1 Tax=Clostridium botulinum TaxID=1491 RepID=UPI00016BB894|nr:hypothetical protein [Clostridium botulinum]EDT84508.1 HD domain protein [Clostridium botulinum Bf]MBY6881659.1 hypothetical protein [Clostridium botulinum]NEZ86281.1 hypothetical protein [Clostridium botulinum]NFB01132.1 hypothetical protein [Clostridium botulinum]NFE30057.1 hypothetical protein [Clostridium botulinum]